jgi:hypothetical protein
MATTICASSCQPDELEADEGIADGPSGHVPKLALRAAFQRGLSRKDDHSVQSIANQVTVERRGVPDAA